ncbi:PH domain-containing protein [Auritidibacter ignavus]|uniref:PH domain-containing protein n=1 Tax=Auritidibacter ignavus TaxID=678932 RepID=UPI002449D91A|nr:PH domain-containing protein [Auritidibacter ignavus]WGH90078.1 PH domain-containing protein [Auritidibacter ignavus]
MSQQHQSGAEPPWRRMHPLTPIASAGSIILVVFFFIIVNLGLQMLTFLQAVGDMEGGVFIILGIIVLAIAALIIFPYLSWRFHKFRITDDAVERVKGWLFVSRRRMRLDRIQAVEIRRPLLARIFGLAELTVEAADGDATALTLQFIKNDEATQLRSEILRKASGAQQGSSPSAQPSSGQPADPGQPVAPMLDDEHLVPMLRISTGRLLGSSFMASLVFPLAVVVLYALAMIVALVIFGTDPAILGIITVIGIGLLPLSVFIAAVGGIAPAITYYGYTVWRGVNGLKITYGLVQTVNQTVPPGRVHAVGIRQPLLWRIFGWYELKINTAGYGLAAGDSVKSTVLPVGSLDDVFRVLSILAPDPGVDRMDQVVIAGLKDSKGNRGGFINAPRRSWWLMPFQFRRHGFAITPSLLLLRSGRFTRALTLLPHDRIQSISLAQGIRARWCSLVSVSFPTASGPVDVGLKHMDLAVGVQLAHFEESVAAIARRYSDRDRWMDDTELQRFDNATDQAEKTLENAQ